MLSNWNRVDLQETGGGRRFIARASTTFSPMSGGGFNLGGTQVTRHTERGVLEGLLNVQDPRLLHDLYRDIYYHDAIGGGAADIMSTLPFGNFTLDGVEEREMLEKYVKSVENLRMKSLMSPLSVDHLVLGAFVGSLNFDNDKRTFSSIMPQSVDNIEFTEVPTFGDNPLMTIRFPPAMSYFLRRASPRVKEILSKLPKSTLEGIIRGKMELDPLSTLFIPRRGMSTISTGTSYFRRLLPVFLLEKALLRGTIDLAYRRQRALLHVIIGDDDWEATPEEITAISNMFMQGDMDPLGAIISTRRGVETNEVRPANDFWQWESMFEVGSSSKMRALGINDGFLSGEASYAVLDAALSVIIDHMRTYRDNLTRGIFYEKIFPTVAVTNGFLKTKEGRRQFAAGSEEEVLAGYLGREVWGNHSTMILEQQMGGRRRFSAVCTDSLTTGIPHVDDITKYVLPRLSWHKSLRPEGDQSYLELMNMLTDKGVPVPLRMMTAAAGVDIDTIVRSLDDDLHLRKAFVQYQQKMQHMLQEMGGDPNDMMGGAGGMGGGGGDEDEGGGGDGDSGETEQQSRLLHPKRPGGGGGQYGQKLAAKVMARLAGNTELEKILSLSAGFGVKRRVGLLNREFDYDRLRPTNRSATGRRQHTTARESRRLEERVNKLVSKALAERGRAANWRARHKPKQHYGRRLSGSL